jgi:hypothetical protein
MISGSFLSQLMCCGASTSFALVAVSRVPEFKAIFIGKMLILKPSRLSPWFEELQQHSIVGELSKLCELNWECFAVRAPLKAVYKVKARPPLGRDVCFLIKNRFAFMRSSPSPTMLGESQIVAFAFSDRKVKKISSASIPSQTCF